MHKNGYVAVGDTNMYYVAFGSGSKNLVVLLGLSDGLTTVKGKAWLLASSYKRFFHEFTVYMFSRKNDMPEGYIAGTSSAGLFRLLMLKYTP